VSSRSDRAVQEKSNSIQMRDRYLGSSTRDKGTCAGGEKTVQKCLTELQHGRSCGQARPPLYLQAAPSADQPRVRIEAASKRPRLRTKTILNGIKIDDQRLCGGLCQNGTESPIVVFRDVLVEQSARCLCEDGEIVKSEGRGGVGGRYSTDGVSGMMLGCRWAGLVGGFAEE